MKKLVGILALAILALTLAGCQSARSSDPLCCVWSARYDGDKSQVMFSFEESADLEVVIWRWDETEAEFLQTESYVGAYKAADGKITYELDGNTYIFDYEIAPNESLTLTYEGKTFVLEYKLTNNAD